MDVDGCNFDVIFNGILQTIGTFLCWSSAGLCGRRCCPLRPLRILRQIRRAAGSIYLKPGTGGSGFGLLSLDPISDVKWCEYILFLSTVHILKYVYIYTYMMYEYMYIFSHMMYEYMYIFFAYTYPYKTDIEYHTWSGISSMTRFPKKFWWRLAVPPLVWWSSAPNKYGLGEIPCECVLYMGKPSK